MKDLDTQPWYRQFWPWFLILLPGSAVVAGLFTLSLAINTSDSLVSNSDDGMNVVSERHISAEHHAASLGLEARVDVDLSSGAIVATLSSVSETSSDWPLTLELELSHPAFSAQDQVITLTSAIPDAAGRPTWSGHFIGVPTGRWYVVLKSVDDWRLSTTWSGETRMTLRPASGDEQH